MSDGEATPEDQKPEGQGEKNVEKKKNSKQNTSNRIDWLKNQIPRWGKQ
ncbi:MULTISPECIES: hypothetical protein [unclassified Rathayibacter]|nr:MULTISPECIES: hypothetical protein [unclassified Rathayibacter]